MGGRRREARFAANQRETLDGMLPLYRSLNAAGDLDGIEDLWGSEAEAFAIARGLRFDRAPASFRQLCRALKQYVERMGRGFAWFDTGTHDSLLEATEFVRTLQKRQGVQIASLEEIAFGNGWIDRDALRERGRLFEKTAYGRALLELADGRG